MTQDQHINDELISELKQSILQYVDETDDSATLSHCLEMLQAARKRREKGDEIVREMAVAGQLRNNVSDKQQLVSYSLANQQAKDEGPETLNQEPETLNLEPEASHLSHLSSHRRTWLGLLTAIVACALIVLAGKYLHFDSSNDEQEFGTVASDYETVEVNGYRFNMVSVKGGSFTMGATTKDGDEDNDELPTQEVTLSDYTIGETEVTQGLWKAVMGSLPTKFDGDNHPMKDISWDDCQQFIEKLNQLTGRHFHLPSEAQWEFAARGGNLSKNYKYAGSNNIDEVAWYAVNTWDKGKESPAFGNHAVGTRKPNELGLYDMSGNVWEWCQDSYAHYDGQPKTDPIGPLNTKNSFRVNRGGSWDYIAASARSCNRRNRTPDFRNFNLGMRLAE